MLRAIQDRTRTRRRFSCTGTSASSVLAASTRRRTPSRVLTARQVSTPPRVVCRVHAQIAAEANIPPLLGPAPPVLVLTVIEANIRMMRVRLRLLPAGTAHLANIPPHMVPQARRNAPHAPVASINSLLAGRTAAIVQAGKYRRIQGKRVVKIAGIIGLGKPLEVAPSRNQKVVRTQGAQPVATRVDPVPMPAQMKVDVSHAHLGNHTVATGSIRQVLATATDMLLVL